MDYFADKARQISCGTCTAFGIELQTRHDKAQQMIEMLAFAQALAHKGLHVQVKKVFYDSNSDVCTFEFTDMVLPHSPLGLKIEAIAQKTISQFDWFNSIQHGAGVGDAPDDLPT